MTRVGVSLPKGYTTGNMRISFAQRPVILFA
jgi:hypothetical protein